MHFLTENRVQLLTDEANKSIPNLRALVEHDGLDKEKESLGGILACFRQLFHSCREVESPGHGAYWAVCPLDSRIGEW